MDENQRIAIQATVNGRPVKAEVESRETLAEFLRNQLNLTGTHVGCEMGACGACTVVVNSNAIRSCLMLAAQADQAEIVTIEGLSSDTGSLHPLQSSFLAHSALQCGFCTPGILMTMVDFLNENPSPSGEEVREALDSHVCRCGSYANVIKAVLGTGHFQS